MISGNPHASFDDGVTRQFHLWSICALPKSSYVDYPLKGQTGEGTDMTLLARHTIAAVVSVFLLIVAVGWAPQIAHSQRSAPESNQGFSATAKQLVDLGPEIAGMEGRQLRMRLITIEPGGHNAIHSHIDRPIVVYFLEGTDTVTLGDGTERVFRPGDTSFANKDTTHWHRNDGDEPVVFVAVDVFHNAQ